MNSVWSLGTTWRSHASKARRRASKLHGVLGIFGDIETHWNPWQSLVSEIQLIEDARLSDLQRVRPRRIHLSRKRFPSCIRSLLLFTFCVEIKSERCVFRILPSPCPWESLKRENFYSSLWWTRRAGTFRFWDEDRHRSSQTVYCCVNHCRRSVRIVRKDGVPTESDKWLFFGAGHQNGANTSVTRERE